MITVTQTIIDVDTVMIEHFYASLTHHAMEGSSWFDDLAIETEVFQVNISFNANLKDLKKIKLFYNVARIHFNRSDISN